MQIISTSVTRHTLSLDRLSETYVVARRLVKTNCPSNGGVRNWNIRKAGLMHVEASELARGAAWRR